MPENSSAITPKTILPSPFIYAGPVDSGQFVGREETLKTVRFYLQMDGDGQCILINGPERMGKSSLLRKIAADDEISANYTPLYFDLNNRSQWSLHKLLTELYHQCQKSCHAEPVFTQDDIRNDGELFHKTIISSIIPKDKPLVLIFDEFDVPGEGKSVQNSELSAGSAYSTFIKYIVSHLIEPATLNIKYIFAVGRTPYDTIPFKTVKTVKTINLKPFNEIECGLLINSYSKGGHVFTNACISKIFGLTRGYPQYIQILADDIWRHCDKIHCDNAGDNIVDQVLQKPKISLREVEREITRYQNTISRVFLIVLAHLRKNKKPITMNDISKAIHGFGANMALYNFKEIKSNLKESGLIKEHFQSLGLVFSVPLVEHMITLKWSLDDAKKELNKLEFIEKHQMILGKALMDEGEYKEAISHFSKVTQKQKENFEAHILLAKAMFISGQYGFEEVNSAYEKAYSINESESKSHYYDFLKAAGEKYQGDAVLKVLCKHGLANERQYHSLMESYKQKWLADYRTFIADLKENTISELGLKDVFFTALDNILAWVVAQTNRDEFNTIFNRIHKMYSEGAGKKEKWHNVTSKMLNAQLDKQELMLSQANHKFEKLAQRLKQAENKQKELKTKLEDKDYEYRAIQHTSSNKKMKWDAFLYTVIAVLVLALIITWFPAIYSSKKAVSSHADNVKTDWLLEGDPIKTDSRQSDPFQNYFNEIVRAGIAEKGASPRVAGAAFTNLKNSISATPNDSIRQLVYISRMYDYLSRRQFNEAINEGKSTSDEKLNPNNAIHKNWILAEAYYLSGRPISARDYYKRAKFLNPSAKVLDLQNKKVLPVSAAADSRMNNITGIDERKTLKICLQNAALHPPVKMATRAKFRLVKAGFAGENISPENLRRPLRYPVNKVYAYYLKPEQKESVSDILDILYPNVPKSFIDLTLVRHTRHKSIHKFFSKKDYDILIRMPNPYRPGDR